jgi:hypothetical protein
MTAKGKYRWRTKLRRRLPSGVLWLAPKGRTDCGLHEWYRHDDHVARCYHCDVGEAPLTRGQSVDELYADAAARVVSAS